MKNLNLRVNPRHLLATLILTCFGLNASQTPVVSAPYTQEQKAQIGKIAEDYLTEHPEKMGEVIATYLAENPAFLVAAQESLHQQQVISQKQMKQHLALQNKAALLDPESPSVGPGDAKTAVVVFFDYQCIYCSKMTPEFEQLMKDNPQVRFVFKELPIFASRWPASGYAARVGQAVWQAKGGAAYVEFHNGIFATGKTEGALTTKDINSVAKTWLSAKELQQIEKNGSPQDAQNLAISKNLQLAQQLQLTGTPAFVVLSQAETEANKVNVFPGSVGKDMLQLAISGSSQP